MAHYEDFPHDDRYWLVKWIDGFRMSNAGSRAVQVQLALQAIPTPPGALSRLKTADVSTLLGFDRNGPPVEYLQHWHGVGSLPAFQVGQVYRNGEHVGTLATSTQVIELPKAEHLCADWAVEEKDKVPTPEEWAPFPYGLIHESEYSLPSESRRSRCLVWAANDCHYVIPRSVVFQRFYAFNTLLAHAFTSGPWAQTHKQAVFTGTRESGGPRTGIDAKTGAWNLILQPRMLDEEAHLLALLYFYPPGRAAAEQIYSDALRERGSDLLKAWRARARLPYGPDSGPVRLRLKGFWLKDRSRGNRVFKRTFLATAILEAPYPDDAALVRRDRRNSGDTGQSTSRSSSSAPYSPPVPQEAPSDLDINDALEPSLPRGLFVQAVETAGWWTPPPVEKLLKEHSKIYEGAARGGAEVGSQASTGLGGHHADGPSPLQHQAAARPAQGRFEAVIEALEQLVTDRVLTAVEVFPSADASQRATRGGLACWTFLDAESRRTRCAPLTGWRLLKRGAAHRRPVPRTALVLRLISRTWEGYWIEIEGRSSSDTYFSPLITGLGAGAPHIIEAALEVIAQRSGTHLKKGIAPMLPTLGGGRVHCYRHDYLKRGEWPLDPVPLRSFIERVR